MQLLRFDLEDLRLAVPASAVQQVVRAAAVAPLPSSPPIVEGVVNVRGVVMPVLDLRARFGLPPRELSPDQHFLLARCRTRPVVLRVDRALDLITVAPEDILLADRVVTGARHVAGIGRLTDGVVVIQDLEAFLALEEEAQLSQAMIQVDAAAPARATVDGAP